MKYILLECNRDDLILKCRIDVNHVLRVVPGVHTCIPMLLSKMSILLTLRETDVNVSAVYCKGLIV